jgi:outer membrane protein OmpA-like peptidoglycan-associated protein
MALDLNKSGDEKTKTKFNLSKSTEPASVVDDKTGQPPVAQEKKGKNSRIILFSLLGIVCLAVLVWVITKNGKSTEPANAQSQQGATIDQAPSSTEASSTPVADTSKPPTTTALNNKPPAATNSPVQNVASIPYSKNEAYKVYLFQFNEFNYSQADPELDKLAEVLKQNPTIKISISAFTDNVGNENYNTELSGLRAKSIRDYLVSKGIDAGRMKYQGKGISTKYENKAENRRAEFTLSE